MFGRETIATDVVFSQDIYHLESINHMSWLPVEKLTTEEREIIQDFNKRKASLLGRYHQQIKDLDTTHETWIGNFSSQHKKKLKICQELYRVEEHKIDKTEYSTDELQAYAIYKPAVDTYKNTKEKVTEKYTKDLEVLNAELDKVAKEINEKLQEREAVAEETRREDTLKIPLQTINWIISMSMVTLCMPTWSMLRKLIRRNT